jgi:hypothetical protein
VWSGQVEAEDILLRILRRAEELREGDAIVWPLFGASQSGPHPDLV